MARRQTEQGARDGWAWLGEDVAVFSGWVLTTSPSELPVDGERLRLTLDRDGRHI